MVFTNPASANDERTFEGTLAEWNALSLVQKTFYTKAIINDDYSDNPVGNLNALTTTDKSSCVGAINELKSGLITPSANYLLLGSAAIDGSNLVTVSLGDNNINDYDFLWIGTSYYGWGVATYGCVLVPTICMNWLYSGDAGVAIMSRDNTNTGVTPINATYYSTNNTIVFNPEGTPAGRYYYVYGVKIRTAS